MVYSVTSLSLVWKGGMQRYGIRAPPSGTAMAMFYTQHISKRHSFDPKVINSKKRKNETLPMSKRDRHRNTAVVLHSWGLVYGYH